MYSDCWSDVLRSTYYTSLVLFHDYRKGLYTPSLDRFARAVAVNVDRWQSGEPGKAIVTRTGAMITVADGGATPELELTTAGTIIVFSRPGGWTYAGATRIVYKVTGAAGYDFYCGNTSQLIFSSGGLASVETVGADMGKCVMVGVSWSTGVVPRFYGNGVFRSVGNNISAPTAEQSTMYIGSAGGGLFFPPPMQSLLMFNAQLTGDQISALYADFMESTHYL